MAVILKLKYLDGLDGKAGEQLIKAKFRDNVKSSNIIRGKNSIYFGENFKWLMARKLTGSDVLEIRVFNYSKYLNNKMIGSVILSLQELQKVSYLSMKEHLVDNNNKVLKITITFDIKYISPDSADEDWRTEDLSTDLQTVNKEFVNGEDHLSFTDTEMLLPIDQSKEYLTFENEDANSFNSDNNGSVFSTNIKRNLGIPVLLDPTMHKCEDYQIAITVIEASQLSGANINPCIEIRVGTQVKKSEVKFSTNAPYFNQYFCFDFHMSKAELFDQIICIKALSVGKLMISRLLSGDLIGEFRMDIGTVYQAPDHKFFNKWAMLIDPKDCLGGAKGYVKCDIAVIGKGDQFKSITVNQSKKQTNDEEDIEANLLLPVGVSIKRQMAEISVVIYRAEQLPKMNTDIVASIKQAFTGDHRPMVDPYIVVSFAGHSEKTKTKKSTYDPQWNEEIIFTEMFPPLCNRIRISIFDWDAVYNECIATHFVDLNEIMNDGENGFLPTFGPSWINLYGTPRNYTYEQMLHPKEELNRGLGEGVAFRGRLLIAIKTDIKQDSTLCGVGAKVCNAQPLSEMIEKGKETFLLVGVIYEAGVIDVEIGKNLKPIFFELSIGTCGNHLDGRFVEESTSKSQNQINQDESKPSDKWCHSITTPIFPVTFDDEYYHIPYKEKKPCLFISSQFEDYRYRMYIANILEKIFRHFDFRVENVHELYSSKKYSTAVRKLRQILKDLTENAEKTRNCIKNCQGSARKTLLDKERIKFIRIHLRKITLKACAMLEEISIENIKEKIRECRALVKILLEMSIEPEHALPDVFIWMIQDEKRIAFARIPARQILFSLLDDERGKDCGKVMTVFLRKPGRKGMGQSGWTLQAQLKIYLWLGLIKDIRHYRKDIPIGYAEETFKYKKPPKEIVYVDKSYFQLRCHMFMARNLIGSDETGLSDVFARIIVNDSVITTKVIKETLSPKWDETLMIEKIIFFIREDVLKDQPPVIVVELFDEDGVAKSEFLGRCFVKPLVTLVDDAYQPPRLEWWEIYRGQYKAGELLAAFELIQLHEENNFAIPLQVRDVIDLTSDGGGNSRNNVFPVPAQIRPALCNYRVEILFWGVRELQRIQLMSVDKPKMIAEFGGYHLQSEIIPSARIKPNFPKPIKYLDIKLPENYLYWPPLMFQCEDIRQFGRKVLVGNHVFSSITEFICKKEDDCIYEDFEKEEQNLKNPIDTRSLINSDESGNKNNTIHLTETKRIDSETNSLLSVPSIDIRKSTILKTNDQNSVNQHSSTPQSRRSTVQSRISFRLDQKSQDVCLPEYVEQQSLQSSAQISEASMLFQESTYALIGTQPLITSESHEVNENNSSKFNSSKNHPGKVKSLNTKPKIPKEELEEVDWWSRYHMSHADLNEKLRRNSFVNRETLLNLQYNEEDESVSNMDVLQNINVEITSEGDVSEILEIPEKKKKDKIRKKNIKRKKKSGKNNLLLKTNATSEFQTENKYHESDALEDNSWIEKFKIYSCSLEDRKEFGGFQAFIRTFPLYRGKQENDEELSENRVVGNFKGNICIYKIADEEFGKELNNTDLMLHKYIPKNDPVSVLVRVYVIRAYDLHPADPNGKSDPYLIIKLGHNVINDKENYIPKQLNPIFGKYFEFDAKIPQESSLHISVMDWDMVSGDDIIGETKIDLENRFYSRHRATCGIASSYSNNGYNKWRDIQLPSQILAKLCIEQNIQPPVYEPMFNKVTCGGKSFFTNMELEDESVDQTTQKNEHLAVEVLCRFEEVSPFGIKLLPEHVETRPLYIAEKPGIEQGRLEMWVDMFPKELGTPPPPVDITPRLPKKYELRVIIWNTDEVILNDDSILTGEKSSDIFVKGWMKGIGMDEQVTDVHYRSLSGEGNFNWRFVFNFEYLKAENKIVYKVKDSLFSIDESEVKAPCKLFLQVWDADIVSADDFLGGLELNLNKMPRGAKSAKSCGLHQLSKDGSVPNMSLFRNRRCRGWWPMIADSQENPGEQDVTGKIDLEIQLLTAHEAEENPAGLGRENPNGLPPPIRPDGSFLWFTNPFKTCKYIIWTSYKWLILKLLLSILFGLLIALFIYSSPGYISKRLIGA